MMPSRNLSTGKLVGPICLKICWFCCCWFELDEYGLKTGCLFCLLRNWLKLLLLLSAWWLSYWLSPLYMAKILLDEVEDAPGGGVGLSTYVKRQCELRIYVCTQLYLYSLVICIRYCAYLVKHIKIWKCTVRLCDVKYTQHVCVFRSLFGPASSGGRSVFNPKFYQFRLWCKHHRTRHLSLSRRYHTLFLIWLDSCCCGE